MHDDKRNPLVPGHERLEMGSIEDQQSRGYAGSSGRRAGEIVDEGQLAKGCAGTETGEASLALFRVLEDLHFALEDDEETFPGIAFTEYDLAWRVPLLE